MRRVIPLLLLLLAPVALAQQPEPAPSLAGSWKLVRFRIDGRDYPEVLLLPFTMVVEGDTLTILQDGKRVARHQLRFNPKAPQEIDLVELEGPNKGSTHKGIFTLKGDEWRLCSGSDPALFGARPADFVSTPQNRNELSVLVRIKSKDTEKLPPPKEIGS